MDAIYNNTGDSTISFRQRRQRRKTGIILVPGGLTGGTLSLLTVTGTAVNGYVPGYTFNGSGTACRASGSISPTWG